jgi:hypothetical protein
MDRFKKCHGLTYRNMCGQSASVGEDTEEYQKNKLLQKKLEGYKSKATGIFFKLFLRKHFY